MSLVARRLRALRVSPQASTGPEGVVARLGAVQAQDYLGALWAVGLRVAGAREEDVERALAQRKIVRTWPMRGTLHFVAAADVRWMTALLSSRPAAAAASRLRRLGIDEALLSRARRALMKALEGGRSLTRPGAYAVLGAPYWTGREGAAGGKRSCADGVTFTSCRRSMSFSWATLIAGRPSPRRRRAA
jgi:hypothetical protein